jgi:hypothetical protein
LEVLLGLDQIDGRGTILLGVVPFGDFGYGSAKLGVMVIDHFVLVLVLVFC